MSVGDMVRARREELGLTKSEAARLAGVSRGTWHEVEKGQRTNMFAGTLNQFDKALGLEPGTLRSLGKSNHDALPTLPTRRRLVLSIEIWVNEET